MNGRSKKLKARVAVTRVLRLQDCSIYLIRCACEVPPLHPNVIIQEGNISNTLLGRSSGRTATLTGMQYCTT